ncbi:hypothetical protein CRUP_013288 [Coryphaenoides rupestris]|nr:hypothetical protein CRUP_013288 [Coryphaenoides rupestris]
MQVAVIVLGNKTDLREQRQVDPEAAQQWARGEKVKLWEVAVIVLGNKTDLREQRQVDPEAAQQWGARREGEAVGGERGGAGARSSSLSPRSPAASRSRRASRRFPLPGARGKGTPANDL